MERELHKGKEICKAVMDIIKTSELQFCVKDLHYSGTIDIEEGRIYETVLIEFTNGKEDELVVSGLRSLDLAKRLLDYFSDEKNYRHLIFNK